MLQKRLVNRVKMTIKNYKLQITNYKLRNLYIT